MPDETGRGARQRRSGRLGQSQDGGLATGGFRTQARAHGHGSARSRRKTCGFCRVNGVSERSPGGMGEGVRVEPQGKRQGKGEEERDAGWRRSGVVTPVPVLSFY